MDPRLKRLQELVDKWDRLGSVTVSWSRWYAEARYEMTFRYGVRSIAKDRYKEQFSLGHTPQQAGRELMQLVNR